MSDNPLETNSVTFVLEFSIIDNLEQKHIAPFYYLH